eukprot:2146801-Amphidinium_carterae.1
MYHSQQDWWYGAWEAGHGTFWYGSGRHWDKAHGTTPGVAWGGTGAGRNRRAGQKAAKARGSEHAKALAAVRDDWHALEHLEETFKNCEEIVKMA